MLSATILYKKPNQLSETFSSLQIEFINNKTTIPLPSKVRKLEIVHLEKNQTLVLKFPNHVTFKDCQYIHDLMSNLLQRLDGQVDDKKCPPWV
ncbi:MAG: hypothetical protein LRY73_10190 [Bacillus sp. (in: Bacteria)]|nr:hypothetical protein [Bacillus sp. (in: firmicutes)]